jgi:O-antigen ligase
MLRLDVKMKPAFMILVCVAIAIPLIPEHVINHLGTSFDDKGSGRLDLWAVGLISLQKYWLTGAGFNNFPFAYNEFVDYWPHFHRLYRGSHNIFLKILVENGIVGFTLIMFAFIRHYQVITPKFVQDNKDEIMLKATFWAILLQGFFNDIIWHKQFWLLWMMILMYRNTVKRRTTENNVLFISSPFYIVANFLTSYNDVICCLTIEK